MIIITVILLCHKNCYRTWSDIDDCTDSLSADYYWTENPLSVLLFTNTLLPFRTDSILTQHLITIADGELLVVSSDDDKELTDDVAIEEYVKVGETPLRQQAQNGRR